MQPTERLWSLRLVTYMTCAEVSTVGIRQSEALLDGQCHFWVRCLDFITPDNVGLTFLRTIDGNDVYHWEHVSCDENHTGKASYL